MIETLLQGVLDKAHKGHRYVHGGDNNNVPLFWKATLIGDCEDFSIWVRWCLLEEYHLDSDMCIYNLKEDRHHVGVSCKGWVLDNLHKVITPVSEYPLKRVLVGRPNGLWIE